MLTDSCRGIALSGFNATPPSIIQLGGVARFGGNPSCPDFLSAQFLFTNKAIRPALPISVELRRCCAEAAKFTFVHFARNEIPRFPLNALAWAVGGVGALEDLPVILVVEDDHSVQSIVEEALSDGGFEPAIAASGEEAVTLLKGNKRKYRALVTDINLLGKMAGWEVAKLAREIDPAFPVVYMTGANADEYGSHGVPNSILLTKPFAPAQLVTAVSQLLNSGTTPPT